MRVSDICSRHVVCVDPGDSVRDAARSMRHDHVGCLIAVRMDEGARLPCGIITDRDIVLAIVAADVDADALTVRDVMSCELAVCHQEGDLFDAIEMMRERNVRRLPVIDTRGRLAGILSADDLYAALGVQMRALGQALAREPLREARIRA